MKTYIVSVIENHLKFVATLATNKLEAFNKVKAKYNGAVKSNVRLSACSIDYVSCEVI